MSSEPVPSKYPTDFSIPDQVQRFQLAKDTNNARVLDIDSVFTNEIKEKYNGLKVLVTGGNRGLGFDLVKLLVQYKAVVFVLCRKSNKELESLIGAEHVYASVDVTDNEAIHKAIQDLVKTHGGHLDMVINNAGYFYEKCEKITANTLNFAEQIKQIDICGLGPLRVNNACLQIQNALNKGGNNKNNNPKLIVITSQAGSVSWRFTQNKDSGGDYGHHMSRASCNMAAVLLSEEIKHLNISVHLLHPGFNRTSMTEKYSDIWDIEGAVEPEVGAKRVLYECIHASIESTGKFINCEDGIEIPW